MQNHVCSSDMPSCVPVSFPQRSSARRSTAALLDSSSSLSDPTMRALLRSHQRETDGPESLSRLHEEAHGVVKAAIKEMTALRILNKVRRANEPTARHPDETGCARLTTISVRFLHSACSRPSSLIRLAARFRVSSRTASRSSHSFRSAERRRREGIATGRATDRR